MISSLFPYFLPFPSHREAQVVQVDHIEVHGHHGARDDHPVDEAALGGHRGATDRHHALRHQHGDAVDLRGALHRLRDAHLGGSERLKSSKEERIEYII